MPRNAPTEPSRAPGEWTSLIDSRHSVAYRIERAPDGGPFRDIAAIPGKKSMGYVHSAKTGRSMPWNWKVQQSRYIQCEVDPDVATFLAQPFCLKLRIDGGEHEFHPDLLIIDRVGRTFCERLVRPWGNPRTGPRLIDFAKQALAAEAISLREVEVHEVVGTVREQNSIEIYGDRWTRMTAEEFDAARTAFARVEGSASYGEATDMLGGPGLGRARLHALIVRGHVDVDLNRPLRPASPVRWLGGRQ